MKDGKIVEQGSRDNIINNMFKDNIKLIRQDVKDTYNKDIIIEKIINK